MSNNRADSESPVEIEQLDEVSGGTSVPLIQDVKNLLGPKAGPVPAPAN